MSTDMIPMAVVDRIVTGQPVPIYLSHLKSRLEEAGYDHGGWVADTDKLPSYDFEQEINPKRSPSWRYARALELKDSGSRVSPRHDGPLTIELMKYLQLRDKKLRANVPSHRITHQMRGHRMGIHKAYQLFRLNDDRIRYMLEARILARQSYVGIRMDHGVPVDAIDWYEKLFFNVADRIDRLDYIAAEIIGPMFQSGLDSHDPETFSKYMAYFTGVRGLEAVNYVFTARREILDDDDMTSFLDGFIQKTVRLQSAYMSAKMIPGRFDIRACLEAYTQILGLDMRASGQSEQSNWIENLIKSATTGIPIPRGDEVKTPSAKNLAQYNVGHVELRASEQNAMSEQGLPYFENFHRFSPPDIEKSSGMDVKEVG